MQIKKKDENKEEEDIIMDKTENELREEYDLDWYPGVEEFNESFNISYWDQFNMNESLASRNNRLAQTQTITGSPRKMEAEERAGQGETGILGAEENKSRMDKASAPGILVNKDDKPRTISNLKHSSTNITEKPSAPHRIEKANPSESRQIDEAEIKRRQKQ